MLKACYFSTSIKVSDVLIIGLRVGASVSLPSVYTSVAGFGLTPEQTDFNGHSKLYTL